MITIYVKTGCPYCALVIHKVDELGLNAEYKNTSDPVVVDELVEKGGRHQEPFLVDDDTGVTMYESTEIVNYLEEHYGEKARVSESVVE